MRKNITILFLLFAAMVVNTMAIAEQLPEQLHFVIKKFEVLGDNPLSTSETDDVFQYYLGDHYGLEGIQAAATAFEDKLRESGFAFYRVNLAPQKLEDGTIKLQLIQLKVDKVTVKGNQYFSKENLARNTLTLKSGESPNTRVLSRALNMADAHPLTIKSYMGGNVEQHKWQHVLVKEGEITGGVFVNASVTANTIITGIKKNDKKLSSDEIRRLLSLDDA